MSEDAATYGSNSANKPSVSEVIDDTIKLLRVVDATLDIAADELGRAHLRDVCADQARQCRQQITKLKPYAAEPDWRRVFEGHTAAVKEFLAHVCDYIGLEAGEDEKLTREAILEALQRHMDFLDKARGAAAWAVTDNAEPPHYRMLDAVGCPGWTDDVDAALWFARRQDAESFAREDEDAWRIIEVEQKGSGAAGALEAWRIAVRQFLSAGGHGGPCNGTITCRLCRPLYEALADGS